MFDTHCHLNFKIFDLIHDKVINDARKSGVNYILIPGADIKTSEKAIEIAEDHDEIFAAVGIHPHHLYEFRIKNEELRIKDEINKLKQLLTHPKVVAIGEVGVDRHMYKKTKYESYTVTNELIQIQKKFLIKQIKLALEYDKSLIIHNWKATDDLLSMLNEVWDKRLKERMVFHCCEADNQLLKYAQDHKIYIGVDGDVVYKQDKQEFVKQIPIDLLVLETDSPYLSPFRKYPNEPKNIPIIVEYISKLTSASFNQLIDATTENAKKLFNLA